MADENVLQALRQIRVATQINLNAQAATMSASDVANTSTLIDEWTVGKDYKQNEACSYKGKLYRASQAGKAQEQYPPDVSEALWYPIEVAEDGIVIYRQAHGQYDAVRIGELRHYPDANGAIYKSLVDYNAYSPEVRPTDWEKQGN